ncbi:MAG: DNA-binding protein, partial [Bacteroidales bacterium]|nr:DNA-binding protein [Bacteroidales bacterium]
MKFKYILTSLVAAAAMLVGCTEEKDTYFDELKVSQSYVSLPVDGGSATIKLTTTDAWELEKY